MVSFYQTNPGRAAGSGDNRGVVSGHQVGQQSGFCIVSWSETDRLNSALLRILPIVVSSDFGALSIE